MSLAETVASRIDGSPSVVSCERMSSGYSNANYRLETSAGAFLLRHRINQDQSEVEQELDILDWLRSAEFPAPAAIRFTGGDRWIAGPEDTYFVLLEWLEGSEPEPNHPNVTSIARALGDFHQLPLPSGDWRHRENPLGLKAAASFADSVTSDSPEIFRIFADEYEQLRDRLSEPLPTGIIHGDLFPDNTLFHNDELVAFLDFEDACEDTLLIDVAMTIHGFCFLDETWTPSLAETFLSAYIERRPLTRAELEALPTYLQWCPLTIMGWHLRQLLRRPDKANERRAGELAKRIAVMKASTWTP
jgi:homoserine kinase type II